MGRYGATLRSGAHRRVMGRSNPLATPERFELPTVSLGRTCSIQLSYGALPRV
jgi:hypothetical protein